MRAIFLSLCFFFLSIYGNDVNIRNPKLIGRDDSWFPLQLGNQTSRLTAFSDGLLQEINHLEKSSLQITNIMWGQLFQLLEEGQLGGVFNALSPNAMTESKYSFSTPLILLGPVLITSGRSTAKNLSDLRGKTVGVYQFDESVLIVQKNPSIVIEMYENMSTILTQLSEGKVDAVLMPYLDAYSLVSNFCPGQLKIISEPLNCKAIRLITLKGQNQPLIRQFNRGLRKMQKNGCYQQLLHKFRLGDF